LPCTRAGLRELLGRAAKQLEPSTTSALLTGTSAAAAAADAKAVMAAAVRTPSGSILPPKSAAAGPGRAATLEVDADRGDTRETWAADSAALADDEDDGDLASRLAGLVVRRSLPVLIIHGLYDRLVPASNSQRLARMLPGCELVLLDRCGHMPQEELPQIFVSLVAEFASRTAVAQAGGAQG
jgi:pimeloyl-ACP methyl ester carboxylesterase